VTTVTRIVTLDPSRTIFLTTLTSDRGIKAEGKNVTTVTRIVALDPPGEPESHNLTTVTRILTLDSSRDQKCDDSYEDRDIGSIRKHVFDDPYERSWHQSGGQKCDDSYEDCGLGSTRRAREP